MGVRMKWLALNSDSIVKNIIVWDGVSIYEPQGITQLFKCEDYPEVTFGWKFENGNWIPPNNLNFEDATE